MDKKERNLLSDFGATLGRDFRRAQAVKNEYDRALLKLVILGIVLLASTMAIAWVILSIPAATNYFFSNYTYVAIPLLIGVFGFVFIRAARASRKSHLEYEATLKSNAERE